MWLSCAGADELVRSGVAPRGALTDADNYLRPRSHARMAINVINVRSQLLRPPGPPEVGKVRPVCRRRRISERLKRRFSACRMTGRTADSFFVLLAVAASFKTYEWVAFPSFIIVLQVSVQDLWKPNGMNLEFFWLKIIKTLPEKDKTYTEPRLDPDVKRSK